MIPTIVTLTSCSVFVPSTTPNIPPIDNNSKPIKPIERINFSTSVSVKNSLDKTLKKIEIDFNKNFNQFSDPNNPNNFGLFENYCPLNLGFPNGLIQIVFDKFMNWYNEDNANYIASGYYNILNILFEFPWIWYLGMNYYVLSLYEWCNSNAHIESVNCILNYLPTPVQNRAYIDLINDSISLNANDKLFKEYWPQIKQQFFSYFANQPNQINNLEYFSNTLKYNMDCIKTMWSLKIPKSFQTSLPNSNKVLTFYEFYLSTTTTPEQLKIQEENIKNQFEYTNTLLIKTKLSFFTKE